MINKRKIEVCLCADNLPLLAENARACHEAGVARVELCANMESDGLTPTLEAINVTRSAFATGELMVMIRPRAGDFCYINAELTLMKEQISQAKQAGADGVVFGVLDACGLLNIAACEVLVQHAKSLMLTTTFHRAFDATPDPTATLASLIDLAFDHILTTGVPWQHKGDAVKGLNNLKKYQALADNRCELVIGGGINCDNIALLTDELCQRQYPISFHSYSGVLITKQINRAALDNLIKC